MKQKRTRGQIEVFGLAFIVILITIGFFIYVSYKAQHKPENVQKEFTNDKVPSDFILAILDVSIEDCQEFTFKDLIIDCARDRKIIDCGGDNSCIALNKSVTKLLNTTFEARGMKYRFYSENLKYPYDTNIELLNVASVGCNETSSQGKSGSAIISLYPSPTNVYINLNVCS